MAKVATVDQSGMAQPCMRGHCVTYCQPSVMYYSIFSTNVFFRNAKHLTVDCHVR